jgi:hypothetical protein
MPSGSITSIIPLLIEKIFPPLTLVFLRAGINGELKNYGLLVIGLVQPVSANYY